MSSGIYKLVFADGSFYIGKSVDISKRWSQHEKAFLKGTHTKKLQEAYDRMGAPKYGIVFECHADHIDILETYFINSLWSEFILNSTRPGDIDDLGIEIIEEFPSYIWGLSTFEHILKWNEVESKIKALEKKVADSKNAKLLKSLEDDAKKSKEELNRIKSRGFFSRMFNRQ